MLGSITGPRTTQFPVPHPTRSQLYGALLTGKVLDLDRALVHLSHTCNLRVDGQWLPVVDVQGLVRAAVTPRGVNRIVVLNSELKPVRAIGYTKERPLFCLYNRLYVWGDLVIDNVGPKGNVLTFTNRRREVAVSHLEANDLPLPPTRKRKSAIQ
jgi:hypothetical protein